MGKKSRTKAQPRTGGEVGPRQPCPCGSGRRYKACHGSPSGPPPAFRARPFEGVPGECDLVALREFVPSATAPLRLRGDHADRAVTLCSLLPGASPAMVRDDGTVWLGLQVQHAYGDPSRDLAACLLRALAAEPGSVVGLPVDPGEGERLQDLADPDQQLAVTVHDGFDYWVAEDVDAANAEAIAAALGEANAACPPSAAVADVPGAYWTRSGDREYLRWVLPYDERPLLDALARLHAGHRARVVEGDRLLGTFRAHGLLAPVWDLPLGTDPATLTEPLQALRTALEERLEDTTTLTDAERSARDGLASRQLTLR